MEEKKKGSNVKAFVLIFVLVILVAVVSYVYLYRPLAEKRDVLVKENHELNTRLIELKNLKTQQEKNYKDGIIASQAKMQQTLNHYSAGNTPEKSIIMVKAMEEKDNVGVNLPNLSFSKPSLLTTVKMPIISESEAGEYSIGYYDVSLWRETLSSNYKCTYEQLKKMIDFVNNYPERMNIESIQIAYNSEDGGLTGDMTINLFAVTGTGKEYVEPDISGLSMGVGNIFGQ